MPALLLFLATLTPSVDPLDNWAHWRGPLADGSSPRGTPPLKWDATTNVRWKTSIPGRGSSTPIVWQDRIFLTTALDTGRKADPKDIPKPNPKFEKRTRPPETYYQFVVLCLDRTTGKILWQKTAAEAVPHEGHHDSHSYAAGSPTTDGKRLYLSFGSQGVYCYDLEGNRLWNRQLGRQETRLGWGEASTPVVRDERVYLTWDHEGPSFLIALDAATGETLWKVPREEPSSWATPLVVQHRGRIQVVTPGTNRVRSYDGATGKEIWSSEGLTINCIPSPLTRDGVAFVMAGYRGARAAAISLDATGVVTGTSRVLWQIDKATPYVPSPVLAGNRLWFTQVNQGIISSVDIATGKFVIDRARLPSIDSIYASPIAVAGRIYVTGRDGTTVVLRQADRLEVLAVNRLGEPVDATPVSVGRQLLLRGERHLWCFEEK